MTERATLAGIALAVALSGCGHSIVAAVRARGYCEELYCKKYLEENRIADCPAREDIVVICMEDQIEVYDKDASFWGSLLGAILRGAADVAL